MDKSRLASDFCAGMVADMNTLPEVIGKVDGGAGTLLGMDRNFECDIVCLKHHCATLLPYNAGRTILDTLPGAGVSAGLPSTHRAPPRCQDI